MEQISRLYVIPKRVPNDIIIAGNALPGTPSTESPNLHCLESETLMC